MIRGPRFLMAGMPVVMRKDAARRLACFLSLFVAAESPSKGNCVALITHNCSLTLDKINEVDLRVNRLLSQNNDATFDGAAAANSPEILYILTVMQELNSANHIIYQSFVIFSPETDVPIYFTLMFNGAVLFSRHQQNTPFPSSPTIYSKIALSKTPLSANRPLPQQSPSIFQSCFLVARLQKQSFIEG